MSFQEIIDGTGDYNTYAAEKTVLYAIKDLADHIKCKDGTRLSVQASSFHYCSPRNDQGPYTHVEVGYPSVTPPDSWTQYADGDFPSDVYGWVPVEVVREFIEAHGGEA